VNEQVKDIWVKALRSSDYTQGRLFLHLAETKHTVESFCCLGVLCDLSLKNSSLPIIRSLNEDDGIIRYDRSSEGLPLSVMAWAELKFSNPDVTVVDHSIEWHKESKTTSLAELNDGGASFSEIADIIEKNWEKM
jgi:hypothetical protein